MVRSVSPLDLGPLSIFTNLSTDELLVDPTEQQQLTVHSSLHHMTALENHNLVSTLDGGEPVGDHKGRSTRHQLLQRLLHLRPVLRDYDDDDDDDEAIYAPAPRSP